MLDDEGFGDPAAERVPGHPDRVGNAEVVEEIERVAGHLGDRVRSRRHGARRDTAVVEDDDLVAGRGQRRGQTDVEGRGGLAATGDEQKRLAVADDVVGKGDVVELDLGHDPPSRLTRPAARGPNQLQDRCYRPQPFHPGRPCPASTPSTFPDHGRL